MQQNEQSHFYHRRLIVTLAGKCQEETDHNIGTHQEKTDHNVGNTHPYSSRWPEEEEVAVAVDTVECMADMVVEEDRTTLAPGRWLRVVSVLHLVTMCLIMDTGQPRISRWELHRKSSSSSWAQIMGRTLAIGYRTRSQWYFQNQSILWKS
jgi:hypothetical protein